MGPRFRMFFYVILSIVAFLVVINALGKDINYSSFGDWLDSQLLLGCVLSISFPVKAWRAYKETQKVKESVE